MNRTLATEFIFLGFSNNLRVNICLFFLFLGIYLVTVNGNVLIMILILRIHNLHTPMYFFICVLSFLDLCVSISVVPRFLADLLSTHRLISHGACAIQFYFIIFMTGTEFLLLALMAYDRYIAICRPLHYPVLMRWSMCYRLTALSVDLCYPNHINHFMCEALAIVQLACDNIYVTKIVMLLTSFIAILFPFMFIIVTYACIISSVLRIHSTKSPLSQSLANQGKYFALFYYIFCPSLNPLIYSLNNKEVKEVIQKMFHKCLTNVNSSAQ
ncbi:hypothetical protein GDO78_022215 [Eleutherodactylus coqui]|uniref:G-protein coupled receptors family 1 profile domain-containing protein n=1 Tax=Eleutherodactylus coqui TaxID=57060 RepID=A0A8J6BMT1_ELECQ|nr:hypothetical protein GDO78_022215 [Eleutherodactylus coqui]